MTRVGSQRHSKKKKKVHLVGYFHSRESASQQAWYFPLRSLQVEPTIHVFHSTSEALSLSANAVRISQPFMTEIIIVNYMELPGRKYRYIYIYIYIT